MGGTVATADGFFFDAGGPVSSPAMVGGDRVTGRFDVRVPDGYLAGRSRGIEHGHPPDAGLEFGGFGLLGDYYPGLGGVRVSGGAIFRTDGGNGLAVGTAVAGDTTRPGHDFGAILDPADALVPTVAFGYGGAIGSRLNLSADLGAMYTGGGGSATGRQAGIGLQGGDTESDAGDFLPYVKLTAVFSF